MKVETKPLVETVSYESLCTGACFLLDCWGGTFIKIDTQQKAVQLENGGLVTIRDEIRVIPMPNAKVIFE